MSSISNFFIGWRDDFPGPTKKTGVIFVIAVTLLAAVISITVITGQKDLIESRFEFGKETTLVGRIYWEPVPMIKVEDDAYAAFVNILLVGFGKHGVDGLLHDLESELERPISDYKITLTGTLIYYDSKTLLELTEGPDSFNDVAIDTTGVVERKIIDFGRRAVYGEIVDAKCFFGAMNPGHGKTHKSCAIRCISGGIPAVVATWDENGNYHDYYLLRAASAGDINTKILPFVGMPVIVRGDVQKVDEWLTLSLTEAYPYLSSTSPRPNKFLAGLCF